MSSKTTHLLFAACLPGLEGMLEEEVLSLFLSMGLSPGLSVRRQTGGVELRGPTTALYRLCLMSRLSESVRLRLKPFVARSFPDLKKETAKLPFRAYLEKGSRVSVHVTSEKSKLWHSDAVLERVREVLVERAELAVVEAGDGIQKIHVRLKDDEVQVSLDASGERMHRRGYRPFVAVASLRETLAFALFREAALRLPPEERAPVLWDPFCGAGTIALEALHVAIGGVPGAERHHAFASWRTFSEEEYRGVLSACRRDVKPALGAHPDLGNLRALLSDRDPKALDLSARNLEKAGLTGRALLIPGDVKTALAKVPEGAFVVTNPPHGKRLEDARAVKQLLVALKKRDDLRPVIVLLGGASKNAVPVSAPSVFRTKSGGMNVSARLLAGTLLRVDQVVKTT